MRRLTALLIVLLALGATLAACGGGNDKKTTASGGTAAPTEKASQTTSPPVYTITTHEDNGRYSFSIPDAMKGGVITLVLDNSNGKEVHDFQLAVPVAGHTLDELLQQVENDNAPLQEWVKPAGGVGSVPPGQTGRATLDLAPGDYWYFCTEANEATHTPHAAHGMSGTLTLTGTTDAAMPKPSATITASEYKFDVSGLHAGENTVKFENVGNQLHMAMLAPIAAGKTFDDVKAALTTPPDKQTGPPPVDFEHSVSTAVIDHGQSEVATIKLAPGKYALLCFMPNKGTAGPPHLAMGMLQEVDIS